MDGTRQDAHRALHKTLRRTEKLLSGVWVGTTHRAADGDGTTQSDRRPRLSGRESGASKGLEKVQSPGRGLRPGKPRIGAPERPWIGSASHAAARGLLHADKRLERARRGTPNG